MRILTVVLVVTFHALEIKAAWGDYDTSFGFRGVAADPVTGHTPQGIVVQPDGKILVTGSRTLVTGGRGFFLRRYLASGQLDTSFGTNGAASGPEQLLSRGSDHRGHNILVLPNGKIAVNGWANGVHAVWQFTAAGLRDLTFGVKGLKILDDYPVPESAPYRGDINLQGGKVLLSLRRRAGDDSRLVLVRLNANGTFDSTFGVGGVSTTDIDHRLRVGTVVESNGTVTVGGNKPGTYFDIQIDRVLANGQPDPNLVSESVFGFAVLPGLLKLADGKYLMASLNIAVGSGTLGFYKFDASGAFDSAQSSYNFVQTQDCPKIFTNQSDGKFIIEFFGKLVRKDADLSSYTEVNYCSNLNEAFTYAALLPNDKMISVGTYNGSLILARTLPY